ncbi:jun dimerization protein 2 isoform X1 [Takifugu rubripes]|uniref:jun dimerization protein 2 isoform X1 n=1 Tax=Takifugu rubripes TaxID=31033 RepID=UPI00114555F3|nr:jun dimerization protein 2 isoform X1 [Takifugu rubripes]
MQRFQPVPKPSESSLLRHPIITLDVQQRPDTVASLTETTDKLGREAVAKFPGFLRGLRKAVTQRTTWLSADEVVEAGSEMMPGQIPDPSLAAGSLPGLGPLAGISATTLTDQLKLADFRQLGTMLSPLHFLGRLGKRPLAIKTEMDEDEERRKRRREKNKVAAARCRNKKKERTDFLQRESERLEMVNSELKAQIEELRQERQQLMVMLNLHRPTCIVRTDSVKTPEGEANPLLEQLSADDK